MFSVKDDKNIKKEKDGACYLRTLKTSMRLKTQQFKLVSISVVKREFSYIEIFTD